MRIPRVLTILLLSLAGCLIIVSVLGFSMLQSRVNITRDVDLRHLPEGTRQMVDLLQETIASGNVLTQPFLLDEKLALIKFGKENLLWLKPKARYDSMRMYSDILFRRGRTTEAIEEMVLLMKEEAIERGDCTTVSDMEYLKFLAIAHLRKGEQDNCVMNHNSKSCTVPFEQEAFHLQTEGAQRATEYLSLILNKQPDDLGSRWLLNIAYMALGQYPEGVPPLWLIPLQDDCTGRPGAFQKFNNIAGKLGIDVNGVAGGVIMDDFNSDGFTDIVASSYGITDQLMYFENDGNGNFLDATNYAGLTALHGGLNIMQTDYNNDGLLDIFIPRGAWFEQDGKYPNSLLKNLGSGKFEDVTIAAGLLSFYPTQAACWGDFNNDGWLDVFIGNEVADEQGYHGGEVGIAYPSELYLSNADGTFTNVAKKLNLEINEFVKGCTWIDYNNDGLQDLFVSIIGRENKLFKNEGGTTIDDWRFTDVTKHAGVSAPVFSFAAWAFDFDNDGWQDLYVSDYASAGGDVAGAFAAEMLGKPASSETLIIYRNNGNGTFTNHTEALCMDKVTFAMGCNFGDLDNDGWLDFYLGTGAPAFEALSPNRMFRNVNGKFFEDVTFAGGFGILQKGHGVSFADTDNDGDQDIYITMGGAYQGDNFPNAFFENPGNGNSWISIRLQGATANRSAIGARLMLTAVDAAGREQTIHRVISSGGSFGANSLRAHIGTGKAVMIKSLTVTWPNAQQSQQKFTNLPLNQFITITEQSEAVVAESRPAIDFSLAPEKPAGKQQHH